MTAAPPVHEYCFEVWPCPLPSASYPILLPDQVTVRAGSLSAGRALATRDLEAGQALGACSHWRSRCDPPHPGRA